MANRMFNQFRHSLEKKVVDLFGEAAIGSSGAVTLNAANSKGIASITKESAAGQYTVVFSDSYQRLMDFSVKFIIASTGLPAAADVALVSRTTTGCVLQCSAPTGTSNVAVATNPASGETMLLRFTMSDSSAL